MRVSSSLAGLTIMLATTATSVQAQGQVGVNVVRGVRIEAPPRQLYASPSILSSESVCASVANLRPAIGAGVNHVVNEINAALRTRVSGVLLVRHGFTVSPRCSALASFAGGGLAIRITLPGNTFVTNVTTPGPLPQSGDPRLAFSFDAEIVVSVAMPQAGGACLGAPRATVAIRNISMPDGRNFTGRIVAGAVDVGSSVYDFFNNGRLGRVLAGGVDWQGGMPGGMMNALNQHLCRSGVPYRSIAASYAPGDQLLIQLSTGARIDDPRCISGFVWRQIRRDDLVCVTPQRRTETRVDDSLADQRAVPRDPRVVMPTGICVPGAPCQRQALPPRNCRPGFVWRLAIANDHVCVTPPARAQAQEDNRFAPRRRADYETPIN